MPGGIKNFEEDLIEEKNFHGDFDNISSVEELYKKAKEYGYEFTLEELQNSEVLDTVLECAAGGQKHENSSWYKNNEDYKNKYLTFWKII